MSTISLTIPYFDASQGEAAFLAELYKSIDQCGKLIPVAAVDLSTASNWAYYKSDNNYVSPFGLVQLVDSGAI